MQSIAKIGLTYSKDEYAIQNYKEVQALSKEMLEKYLNQPIEKDNYFVRDVYPTPNIGTRVLIEYEGKFLFVREAQDHKYAIPGGWCDIFYNARENAYNEVLQETGYEVELDRVLAVFHHNEYEEIKSSISVYSIIFSGKIVGGSSRTSHETDEVVFYSKEEIPELSTKITRKELDICLDVYYNNKNTYFD